MASFKHNSTVNLLHLYVWGKEPDSLVDLIAELRKRKVSLEELRDEVDAVIDKYSWFGD